MNLLNKIGQYYIVIYVSFFLTASLFYGQKQVSSIEIRGVYGNPKAFWDRDVKLNNLGVNAVFVHSGSISHKMIKRAREEGAMVFAEFATLNGKNYVDKHPEAWAINEKGEKVKPASWFMGVCPTNSDFKKYRFKQLKDLLLEYDLNGVWLDYVHWHAQFEDPEPILPETCFCENCIETFSSDSDTAIPEGTIAEKANWILTNEDALWRDWRCKIIFNWTVETKKILKEIRPEALLGLYHCPWKDDEFDSASRRILGLDFDLLKETIDVFSPMVYHARMGKNPNWVEENIIWFGERLEIGSNSFPKIWPIVQAHDDPTIISTKEFTQVLRGGMSGKSSGIMMFTSHSVAKSKEKTQAMKNIYLPLSIEE